jgi:hypothetical protein
VCVCVCVCVCVVRATLCVRVRVRVSFGLIVDASEGCYGSRFQGLRVADASVMPTITSGNTAAPTMAIAERAAHLIKL